MKSKWKIGFSPSIFIPLVVFFISQLLAYFISILGNCHDFFHECWVRWDSGLYLQIAKKGHTLFLCTPDLGEADKWCGTAGFAPLYPWIIRMISSIGMHPISAGILISNLFYLAYLMVVSKLIEIQSYQLRNWLLISLVAFCPGNIYFHAVFPLSQAVFFMALLMYFLKKENYLWAGIAGFFGVLSYSIGFFLIAALGLFSIVLFLKERKVFVSFFFKTFSISLAGLFVLFGYDQWKTGHWNAMFLVQEKYGHSLNSPIKILGIRLDRLIGNPINLSSWIEIQNLFVFGMVLFLAVWLWRSKSIGKFRFFYALYIFLFWFLPYSASAGVGLYRNVAMLGPGYSQTKGLPTWALVLLLSIFIGFSIPMGMLFIYSTII